MKPVKFLESVPEFKGIVNRYYEVADVLELDEAYYCLSEMLEGSSFEWYQTVANICKQNGITKVYDIGANVGVQRFFFESLGIEYIPVDEYEMANINGALDGLINKKYPFEIHAKENDALISHLCLGYLVNFEDCYKQLLRFNYLFVDKEMNNEKKEFKKIILDHECYGKIYFYEK